MNHRARRRGAHVRIVEEPGQAFAHDLARWRRDDRRDEREPVDRDDVVDVGYLARRLARPRSAREDDARPLLGLDAVEVRRVRKQARSSRRLVDRLAGEQRLASFLDGERLLRRLVLGRTAGGYGNDEHQGRKADPEALHYADG
jgi:hypothetical protein